MNEIKDHFLVEEEPLNRHPSAGLAWAPALLGYNHHSGSISSLLWNHFF